MHHARARQLYNEIFRYFGDLNPSRVAPLVAPGPLLVITEVQDDQFDPFGASEADDAVRNSPSISAQGTGWTSGGIYPSRVFRTPVERLGGQGDGAGILAWSSCRKKRGRRFRKIRRQLSFVS